MNKEIMIKAIYDNDTIAGRFWGNTLEIGLNEILSTLYGYQEGEWKLFEENSQFPQIILDVCDLYKLKREPIENQSTECIAFVESLLPNNKEGENL